MSSLLDLVSSGLESLPLSFAFCISTPPTARPLSLPKALSPTYVVVDDIFALESADSPFREEFDCSRCSTAVAPDFKTASTAGDGWSFLNGDDTGLDGWEQDLWMRRWEDGSGAAGRLNLSCARERWVLSAGGGPFAVSTPWLLCEAGGRFCWSDRSARPGKLRRVLRCAMLGELVVAVDGGAMMSEGAEGDSPARLWPGSRGSGAVCAAAKTDAGADAQLEECADAVALRRALNLRDGISASAGFDRLWTLRGEWPAADAAQCFWGSPGRGEESTERPLGSRRSSKGGRPTAESVCLLGRGSSFFSVVSVGVEEGASGRIAQAGRASRAMLGRRHRP